MVVEISRGYPAHLQVFADETWMRAAGPTITDADAGLRASRMAAPVRSRSEQLAEEILTQAPDPVWARAIHGEILKLLRAEGPMSAVQASQNSGRRAWERPPTTSVSCLASS